MVVHQAVTMVSGAFRSLQKIIHMHDHHMTPHTYTTLLLVLRESSRGEREKASI